MKPVQLLGICGSPRAKGNSQYLLEIAMEEAKKAGGDRVQIDMVGVAGKKIGPCLYCLHCAKHNGECAQKDSFTELRDKWVNADAIIYSVPVFHMGIPGQLKCFIDRVGCSFYDYMGGLNKSLMVVGVIVNGAHLTGGQEGTATALINHTLVMGGIPVTGDMPDAYIAAGGWTRGLLETDSVRRLAPDGGEDVQTLIRGARAVGRRVAQMALIIRAGAEVLRQELAEDGGYSTYLRRV